MANEDTLSFQQALDKLHLQEEELKRLVSQGEILAFRDGDDMRLRRSDIDSLSAELGDDIDFADEDFDDPGMATAQISAADTLIDDIDDVDDIDDIDELDDEPDTEDEEEILETTPIASFEEEFEGMGTRVLMMATTVVLIMAVPIIVSIATGSIGGMARGIGGIFNDGLK